MTLLRRAFASALLGVLSLGVAFCQEIRNVETVVHLYGDGSARIDQKWDVTVVEGTEWYIPIGNLQGMSVSDLVVVEDGVKYEDEGRSWDVDRSLEEKAFRSGIVDKGRNSVELCWGEGSMGDHVWLIAYTVTGLVKSYKDYDGFNYMFVNPGLVASPKNVTLRIVNDTGGKEWTIDNTKVWGFGSIGNIYVKNGQVEYDSTEPYGYDSKLIAMVRFDKGMLSPAVSVDKSFDDVKEEALKDSDYSKNEDWTFYLVVALMSLFFIIPLLYLIYMGIETLLGKKYSKKIFGVKKIDGYWREPPFQGDICTNQYVFTNGMRFRTPKNDNLIGAFFLKWIMDGVVTVKEDLTSDKATTLIMNEEDPAFDSASEKSLYKMAYEAAGSNRILEPGEFEDWSYKHDERVFNWPKKAILEGGKSFKAYDSTISGYSREEEAQHAVQFKNFLKHFTLSDQRSAFEVKLWKDYLVFAQMYGVADKVAKQMKKLYPADFEKLAQAIGISEGSLANTISANRITFTRAYNMASSKYADRQIGSSKGLGGGTSFGGGGGFSGGGFGGGSR